VIDSGIAPGWRGAGRTSSIAPSSGLAAQRCFSAQQFAHKIEPERRSHCDSEGCHGQADDLQQDFAGVIGKATRVVFLVCRDPSQQAEAAQFVLNIVASGEALVDVFVGWIVCLNNFRSFSHNLSHDRVLPEGVRD